MRRIEEPVESLTPSVAPVPSRSTQDRSAAAEPDRVAAPLAFRWRGRRYVVGAVLAHWVETGAWWRGPVPPSATSTPSVADPERLMWRVEACRGAQTGVFDLCCETSAPGTADQPSRPRWVLQAIHD